MLCCLGRTADDNGQRHEPLKLPVFEQVEALELHHLKEPNKGVRAVYFRRQPFACEWVRDVAQRALCRQAEGGRIWVPTQSNLSFSLKPRSSVGILPSTLQASKMPENCSMAMILKTKRMRMLQAMSENTAGNDAANPVMMVPSAGSSTASLMTRRAARKARNPFTILAFGCPGGNNMLKEFSTMSKI